MLLDYLSNLVLPRITMIVNENTIENHCSVYFLVFFHNFSFQNRKLEVPIYNYFWIVSRFSQSCRIN